MAYKLTKQQIKKELIKCGKSAHYFINNYVRIQHPMDGIVPFKMFDFQGDTLDSLINYRFNVVLKARQLGLSTLSAAYIAWLMLFHRGKSILIVATKKETAANLLKKVKLVYKMLPEWFFQLADIKIENTWTLELTNASIAKAASTSSDVGRSEALSLLVVDEAAYVEGMDELWSGIYYTLSTGGSCIALSTPAGASGWFYNICMDAQAGLNDFYLTTLMWYVHPDRDQAWFDKETKSMSKRQIAAELLCSFNLSGETVIAPEDIERIEEACTEPVRRTGFDRNYWIWQEFNEEGSYLMVADVSRGDGNDYSAFHVIRLDTMAVVAEYKGKPEHDMYSDFLFQVGMEYGECMIVVENNNLGIAVLNRLKERGYRNVYHSLKGSHEYVDQIAAEGHSNAIPGFTTSTKTRPLLVAKLEEYIRHNSITLPSLRLVDELRTFIWNNGKAEHAKGRNDDLVMSLAIGCWVRDTVLIANQREQEYREAFLNAMTMTRTNFNSQIRGQYGFNDRTSFFEGWDHMSEEKEKAKEFGWLIGTKA